MRFVLAPGSAPERVDRALARLLPDVSRSTIQRWMSEGRVLVGGKPCRPRDPVGAGSVLEVDPGPAPSSSAEPDPTVSVDVLFEDPHLVVVNKPPGLVVHPARGHRTGTLVNGLLARPGFQSAPFDERDQKVTVNIISARGRREVPVVAFAGGATEVLTVTDSAQTLVLYADGEEVERIPLALVRGEVNEIRP